MKVLLQINVTCNWGSTGRICEGIAETANADDWDCYLAHGARYVNVSAFPAYSVGSKWSNYRHVIYSMLTGRHGLGSNRETHELINYINDLKPDIIHLHNIHGYYLNYKILFEYLRDLGTPVVWTLHDCWAFTGHCAHFDHIGCNKWKTQCKHCPLIHYDYKSLYFDNSTYNYNLKRQLFTSIPNMQIVSVSKWLGNLAGESFLGKYNVRTIYNGIDTEIFKPQESDIKKSLGIENKKMLLAVGTSWDKNKGLYDYIELSKKLSADYRLVLVGISPKIKKFLPSNIISIERTHNTSMLVDLYSAAEIVLNLSYLETFGLPTAEGLACGTPGIVYNKTATPELLSPDTGVVVEAGNIEDVLKAIEIISHNGKNKYSEACRKRVLETFEKQACYMQYVELYNDLLSNK